MTGWVGVALRRAAAARALLVVLLALVAVVAGLVVGSLGHWASLADETAADAVADSTLTVRTRLAADPTSQDEAARKALAGGLAPTPVTVLTSYDTEPQRVGSSRVTLAAGPLFDSAVAVEGALPAAENEAAVPHSAADALGLEVGDEVSVAGRTVTVTGTWRLTDARLAEAVGSPLLVADEVVAATDSPFVQWTVLPGGATASGLGTLAAGAGRARELAESADLTGRGVTVGGDLAAAAASADTDLELAAFLRIVPLTVLLLVAAVGLVQVAVLLAAARESEVGLLFARGAARRQVLAAGLAEALVVAVCGTALGALLVGQVNTGAVVSLALSAGALGGVAIRSSRPRDGRDSGRLRAVAGAASLALVCALAALTTWQLYRNGRLAEVIDAGVVGDPVAALSPALLLAAVAVAALAVLAPVTRLLELATRTAGTPLWLAGAQLARALRLHAVPVVLIVLATSTATFSAVFAGSAARYEGDVAALAAGAPVRATLSSTSADDVPLPAAAGLASPTPVWRADAGQVGNLLVPMLAAPTDSLARVAILPGGATTTDLSDAAADTVPVALTTSVARDASLEVGDALVIGAFGARFDATVAAVVDTLPRIDDGALVDSAALERALTSDGRTLGGPAELWAGDGTDDQLAALAAEPGVTDVTRPTPASADGPTALTAGSMRLAAVGAVALAAAGVAAASAAQLRARRPEVAVLRALGMTPAAQAAARVWESAVVAALAAAAGVAGGLGVAALVTAPLAHSTGADLPVALVADLPQLAALLAAGATATAVVVALAGAAVLGQARDAEYREEVR